MYKEIKLPQFQRELFIYRIINKYIKYNNLKIFCPTPECYYESQIVYNDIYHKAIENEVLTEAQLLNIIKETGEWDDYSEQQLEKILPSHIKNFQKEIYNNFENKKMVEQIYLYLNRAREEIINLSNKKYTYNYLTAEGLAVFARIQHIVEFSTFEDGRPCDWEKHDIKDVISFFYSNYIDDSILRYLCRTNPWHDIWSVSKKNNSLFGDYGVNLSEDQRRLVSWSALYDNIQDYPDCPKDSIIECDDALDGWLLIKKEEQDKNKALDSAENNLGAAQNAQEVFKVVSSKEQAKEIYDLNSPMNRAVVKNRLDTIQKLGEAKDEDFGDVRQKLLMMQTQAEMGRR